ncbi:MAG: Wzz/FepE/Etk N-terminal domain-containing protein [Pontibacterium sp.]
MSTLSEAKHTPYVSNEIDLFELFAAIWQQKTLISIITLIFALAGVGYAYKATPVYESRVYLLPPANKDTLELQKLNFVSSTLNTAPDSDSDFKATPNSDNSYSSRSVYNKFLLLLDSHSAKRSFFEQSDVNKYFIQQEVNHLKAWQNFNKNLSINLPTTNDPVSVSISFRGNSPELAARWANEYISSVITLTQIQLATDVRAEISSKIQKIEQQIKNRQALYKSKINVEIAKLNEALQIAKALGLTQPLRTDSIIDDQNLMMIDEVRRLYKLGSDILEAEITVIRARKNSEIFIPELSDLLQQQTLFSSIKIEPNKIQPVLIDLPAEPNSKPIKPRKALMIVIFIMLGAIIGIVIAAIRTTIHRKSGSTV